MTDYHENPATNKQPEELTASQMRQGTRGRGTLYAVGLGTVATAIAVIWVFAIAT